MPPFKDMTGQKFNRLTVIERVKERSGSKIKWKCLCDCGNITYVNADSIRNGKSKSCGCLQKEYASHGQVIDLVGEIFGRLTVVSMIDRVEDKDIKWLCQCDCGNTKIAKGSSLRKGHTESCGCKKTDMMIDRNTSHGKSKTRLYSIWCGIINRCCNPNNPQFKDYGGRGITICDEWRHDFEQFIKDMGECPKGLSIDRIDNNKGYYKDNCRWTTREVQGNNTRRNINIEYNGKTQTLSRWSKETGVNYGTLINRVYRNTPINNLFLPVDVKLYPPRKPNNTQEETL